ncbi:chaperonin 10-like protein [Scheffersomyces xylosifermentans]|uniref:chaperonin 10-like protein n=1 Tax=Scheffersomyces xylosifermentans TaxID=1304137 RepID=UPI00315D962A
MTSSIPTKQTAYGYVAGSKQLQKFENHPVAVPKEGQALLKIEAAGLCMSDPHVLIVGPMASRQKSPDKFVMGHEIAGQLVQLGPGVDPALYKVGSRYVVTINQSCGTCVLCRSGNDGACSESLQAYGLNDDGGFQEYMLVKNLRTLLPIPDGVSYEVAAVTTDSVLTPFNSIEKVKSLLNPTTKVLVTGLGGLGLNAVQILSNYHCQIVACDIKEEARDVALKFGASEFYTDIFQSSHEKESFDLCFDFAGTQQTWDASQAYVKTQGKIMMVGLGKAKLTIRNYELARREIGVIFTFGGTSTQLIEALRWVALGRIKPIAKLLSMDELPENIIKLVQGKIQGRVVFRPSKL